MHETGASSQEAWKTVLDTVLEGIVMVNEDGSIRYINEYATEMLRVTLQRSLGKHFREVFCPDLPPNQCWITQAIAHRKTVRNHRFEVQDGYNQVIELYADLTPIEQSGYDVAGALLELRSSHETRLLLKKSKAWADVLIMANNEMRITRFNRSAEVLIGWTEKDALGRFCTQIFPTLECFNTCPLSKRELGAVPVINFETELLCDRHGKKLPIYVNVARMCSPDGKSIAYIFSFSDTSSQSKLEKKPTYTNFYGLVGKSKRMLEVFNLIEEVAANDATVLVLGESGTGKELVASAIQRLSLRKDRAFLQVNCAAIPENLMESELFGHVKGAFTGAYTDHVGLFERADGGTIFLDEIGDLTHMAQLRLLRVLEEGEFLKLGSSKTVKVNVRVIAATNRNLRQMVRDGTFRDDLYYRLSVIPITLPPLRERHEDLSLLIEHFMEKYRRKTGKPIVYVTDEAYERLMSHDYAGNVRELENIIEYAFTCTKGNMIARNKLPEYLQRPESQNLELWQVSQEEKANERNRIRQALVQCHWNREQAAKKLGISRSTLWRRMRELDLIRRDSRSSS
ncbi:PAS domain S-box protein [candidate division KSB1 bacterium]|nr:PAS domain S-box protein [candidate division KSB1 bacterium]NIU24775.1 PAS domain S-box protein [candidate division KSB1 bacterium]NIW18627.1 PAS domain S-box protein [candidate division KSB1 bacterium]